MEKLELKHLAPYLPYGLKINTAENEMYLIDFKNKKIESLFRGHLINIYEWDEFKPILRPLSDLTSNNLIDMFNIAYKFVFDRTDENLTNFHMYGWDEDDFGCTVKDGQFIYGFSVDFEHQKDFRFSCRNIDTDVPNNFMMIDKLQLFEYLFKNHFDVFGLIEENLAIDINTLK